MKYRGQQAMTLLAILSLASACSFDASGKGGETGSETGAESSEGSGTASSEAGSGSETTDPSTSDATTDATTTDASTTDATTTGTTTDASTTDPSTTDPSTSGPTSGDGDGDGDCNGPAPELKLFVQDAEITAPMMVAGAGEEQYAFSVVEGAGTATFTWQQECDAEYFVWGFVWDQLPGVTSEIDPDSFHFAADASAEIEWVYGCTSEASSAGWSWQPVTIPSDGPGGFCDGVQRIVMTVPAGPHSVTLRNREFAPDAQTSAAIVKLLFTEDESRVPDPTND